MPVRTFEGTLAIGESKRLIDDGRTNIGYKVTGFTIWMDDGTGTNDAQCFLSYLEPTVITQSNASDNQQFAWALTRGGSYHDVVSPNHMVTEEAWITNLASSERSVNYMVVLEQKRMTTPQRIINLIKQRSQGTGDI